MEFIEVFFLVYSTGRQNNELLLPNSHPQSVKRHSRDPEHEQDDNIAMDSEILEKFDKVKVDVTYKNSINNVLENTVENI